MSSELEKTEIKYGHWFWDHGLNRPVFTLYPYTDTHIACLCPVIKFDQQMALVGNLCQRYAWPKL